MSAVLDIDNLLESPLADLHALAGELEIEDYRKLRKPELTVAILEARGISGDDVRPAVEAKAGALAEAKAAAGKLFDKLNKDKAKDSTLDAKELKGRLSAKELKAADPDKDGTIDKAEYMKVVEARFAAANPDKDGTIDCKEASSRAGKALMRLLK